MEGAWTWRMTQLTGARSSVACFFPACFDPLSLCIKHGTARRFEAGPELVPNQSARTRFPPICGVFRFFAQAVHSLTRPRTTIVYSVFTRFSPGLQRISVEAHTAGSSGPEARAEVAQERRLLDDLQAPDLLLPRVHFEDGLHHIIDVALGVDAARDRQPQQLVLRRSPNITEPISTERMPACR